MSSLTSDIDETVRQLLTLLQRHGYSLAVAESCTGGLIADLLTDIPGASAVFTAGIIAYAAEAKVQLLGLDPAQIAIHGVVSDQTVRAMAGQMRLRAGADYAIATTGNLGPSSLEGKPCGLVYVAACSGKTLYSRELRCTGSRRTNKRESAFAALTLLKGLLDEELLNA